MEKIPNQNEIKTYRMRLDALVDNIHGGALENYFNDISTKVREWKEVYGDEIMQYELYHMLIGSTPASGQRFKAFDLPGEDSIAAFIEELEKKYKAG